jgi:hypothetical protein
MPPNLIKDPATGAWFEQLGNTIRPWDGPNPDQMAAGQAQFGNAGPGQAFGMGIVNALGGNYWAPALAGVDPNQYRADMAAIQGAQPLAYGGGHLAAGLPLAVMAGPTMAGQAIAGAALGALGSSSNPIEAGLTGGAIGGAVGAFAGALPSMAQRVTGRLMRSSLENDLVAAGSQAPKPASTFDSLVNAGLADDAAVAANDITMGGVAIPATSPRHQMIQEMAQRQGLLLTPGEELGSKTLRMVEASMESNPLTAAATLQPIRQANQGIVNSRVNQAMASVFPEGTVLTNNLKELGPETVGAFRQQLGQNFNKIYAAAGDVSADEITKTLAPVMLTPEGMTYGADKVLATILARTVNGQMTPAIMADTRNFLSGMAFDLGRAPGSQMQANVYSSMVTGLDNLIESKVGTELAGQLVDNRQGWRLLMALEKPGVIKENGNVIPGALYRNIRKGYRDESLGMAPLRANSETQNKALANLVETLRVTQYFDRVVGDSGTATRMSMGDLLKPGSYIEKLIGPAVGKAYMAAAKSGPAQRLFQANQARATIERL